MKTRVKTVISAVLATATIVYFAISFIAWDIMWGTNSTEVHRAAFLTLFLMAVAPVWMVVAEWFDET